MYPVSGPEDISRRTLSADDAAFVAEAYPLPGAPVQSGGIAGSLQSSGGPVPRAEVIAIDPSAGVAVGTMSDWSGHFTLSPLPPGSYFVYAQPVDLVARTTDPTLVAGVTNFDWQAAFYGPSGNPSAVTVTVGSTASVNIKLDLSPATLRIDFVFGGPGASTLPSGTAVQIQLLGKGFDPSITPGDLLLLGPGLSIEPDTLQVTPSTDPNQDAYLSAGIVASARSGWPVAVIGLRSGGKAVPGPAMRIAPPGPMLTASGVVNAASYQGGSVAPGEILTAFGFGVGPDATSPLGYDSSGRLGTSLGGVTVDFDGFRAPLFYVSPGQINLQAPMEIAGKVVTTMHLSYQGLTSAPVLLSVSAAQPGIFGALLNQDGSLNSPSNPAPRGSVVVLFGTGQGLIAPSLATGQPAPSVPLSQVAGAHAFLAGTEAPVWFAGMAPGFVGLLQMNVFVPADAQTGDAVSLQIEIAGQRSPAGSAAAIR
jgi:uncharacterized protein (TIGR03437 family)